MGPEGTVKPARFFVPQQLRGDGCFVPLYTFPILPAISVEVYIVSPIAGNRGRSNLSTGRPW